MENCIFCKIVAGEIPSRTLFEDEDFIAQNPKLAELVAELKGLGE